MSASIEEIRSSVSNAVEEVVEHQLGYNIIFPNNQQLLKDLRAFTDHESACCSFLNFSIVENREQLVCEVRVIQYDVEIAKEIISTLFST